jgi:hypothetical protein
MWQRGKLQRIPSLSVRSDPFEGCLRGALLNMPRTTSMPYIPRETLDLKDDTREESVCVTISTNYAVLRTL